MTKERPYPYMPPGSFAVTADWETIFLQEVPDELKERLLKDVEINKQEYMKTICDPNGWIS